MGIYLSVCDRHRFCVYVCDKKLTELRSVVCLRVREKLRCAVWCVCVCVYVCICVSVCGYENKEDQ